MMRAAGCLSCCGMGLQVPERLLLVLLCKKKKKLATTSELAVG
jgi:hypothetical protein